MIFHTPRVFVGTMHCGEGDYAACCDAVRQQVGVNVTHMSIDNLPERDAHNALWRAWRAVQHEGFDMFVKVDADTVLAHNEVLFEFWKYVRVEPRVTGIQAPLMDYFTDGFINGLNCFTPAVIFRDTNDPLYCDRNVDIGHDVTLSSDRVCDRLRPAGYHCYNATNEQAFHYGLHRALKHHGETIERVRAAWLKHRDERRAYALLGAQRASSFTDGGFNYADDGFRSAFNETVERYGELVKNVG